MPNNGSRPVSGLASGRLGNLSGSPSRAEAQWPWNPL